MHMYCDFLALAGLGWVFIPPEGFADNAAPCRLSSAVADTCGHLRIVGDRQKFYILLSCDFSAYCNYPQVSALSANDELRASEASRPRRGRDCRAQRAAPPRLQ